MKKTKLNKNRKLPFTNTALLNLITPVGGIEFGRNYLYLGENKCRIYTVSDYNATVHVGWLSKLSNIPGTVSTQIFIPANNSELLSALSRSVTQNRGIYESTRDALTAQRAEKAADDAEQLMIQIDRNGEQVGYMVNLIMAVGKSDEDFTEACRRVETTVQTAGGKVRALSNLQVQALKTLLPYAPIDDDITEVSRRNVAMSTFMGGFPFASSSFKDSKGYPFADDMQGGVVVLDSWIRGGDRTNSNWVIMGQPGSGKSYAVKHIAVSEYQIGTKIIFIDPEREVRQEVV